MSVTIFVVLALAGGVGAALRLIVDTFITAKTTAAFPWGTLIINVAGSFVFGLVVGLGIAAISPQWFLILSSGLLGGFTTFSTASLETVALLAGPSPLRGIVQGFSMLVLSCAAAGLGLVLGA